MIKNNAIIENPIKKFEDRLAKVPKITGIDSNPIPIKEWAAEIRRITRTNLVGKPAVNAISLVLADHAKNWFINMARSDKDAETKTLYQWLAIVVEKYERKDHVMEVLEKLLVLQVDSSKKLTEFLNLADRVPLDVSWEVVKIAFLRACVSKTIGDRMVSETFDDRLEFLANEFLSSKNDNSNARNEAGKDCRPKKKVRRAVRG